jgi:hypothetical protein
MNTTTTNQPNETPLQMKQWADMSPSERQNIRYLREQLGRYETALELENSPDIRETLEQNYRLIEHQVTNLKVELRKKLDKKSKELAELDEESDKHAKLVEYYHEFLAEHEIYYVASEHLYMEYFSDTGKWEQLRPEALHKQYAIRGTEFLAAFDDAMGELERKKMSVECSFFDKPERILNLMRRDHWLKPIEGEPHAAFHLLIKSLGNNKPENMDHIEQLVYWKYVHPEEYRLPCLVIYGEGGVGKNTFVKEVLGTLFGSHQVLVADAEKTIGQFNGMIQGKTVVMIDEAIADKVNAERLKRTVGNRTVDINPKYGKQGEHDNTPLYLAGGNDNSGAILLAGDATDRRWSIIKVEKSIIQRLAEDQQIPFDQALVEYKRMEHVYTTPEEVAKWLHYLIAKWSHLEMPPVGLHAEDYHELLETQKSPFEELMEIVFGQEDFEHIEGSILYQLYQEFVKATNPAARGVMGRNKFYANVRTWNDKNNTGVKWGPVKITSGRDSTLTSAKVFYQDEGRKTFTDNNGMYLSGPETIPYWERVNRMERVKLVVGYKEHRSDETDDEISEERLEKLRMNV